MLAGLMALAAASAAIPAEPVSRWNLENTGTSCRLTRDFKGPQGTLTFELLGKPPEQTSRIAISGTPAAMAALAAAKREEPVAVAINGTAGLPVASSFIETGDGMVGIVVLLQLGGRDRVLGAKRLDLSRGNGSVALAINADDRLKRAMDDCETGLLRGWGIDPAIYASQVQPPIGLPTAWLSNDDYPAAAIRARQQGAATIIWRISERGKAEDCRVIESSGSEALDQASCHVVVSRARYSRPSRDASGNAIVSWNRTRLNWILPR